MKRTPEMETSMSRRTSCSCLNCLLTGPMEEHRPLLKTNNELKREKKRTNTVNIMLRVAKVSSISSQRRQKAEEGVREGEL